MEYKFLPTLMWKYNYEPGFDTEEFSKSLNRIGIQGNYEAAGGLTTAGMGENIHEWPSIIPFLNWLKPKIEIALNEWQVNYTQYFITKSWVNRHPRGGYTRTHDRGSTPLVGSIYIKQPENGGNVEFENFMRREWVSYMRKDEPGNMHDYYSEVPIKTNDVLIFPGWMSHRAQPSKSNEERLVFTLNYFAQ